MATLRVQSILFHNEPAAIERTLDNLHRAADIAIAAGDFSAVEVAYGDCSSLPVFDAPAIERLRARHAGYLTLHYEFFGENRGSALGHNSLLEKLDSDFVLIMNPDIVVAPNTLHELKKPFARTGVGMVEARQMPIEHPKEYHPSTGETSWAATACTLIPRDVVERLGGFDHAHFFLYCDDVDFSWRVRLDGLKVIYQPSAVVFHDKRLSDDGKWITSAAERYYSAEAALLLSYKWSREDRTRDILAYFRKSGVDFLQRAAEAFDTRRTEGRLPAQLDPAHKIGQFVGDNYANHRFLI